MVVSDLREDGHSSLLPAPVIVLRPARLTNPRRVLLSTRSHPTDAPPGGLVWSTRDPRATYGDGLIDEVQAAQPDALIWDTTQRGKPDLVALALRARRDFDAEAVIVVSNKPATQRLVHALEQRGIPAFGPIWDS